ncbi:recombinase family protein [Pararhizobium mangrovi]|uniref:Recombinase family protein n=1 Tax=Pararhizobium mangrovi TaxID=2590452 RepID=A0A506TZU7_9HYPH|nr:recombinase family protein [Pararhizobium mangrovi]TPW25849.1 recombinase family protein [Pararhizobium mangrovi]
MQDPHTQFVAYYRVSTQRQGDSGLGLGAQQDAVRRFCGGHPILAHFTEIESGRNDNRPELEAALAHARTNHATLVIAKLDRLARSVSFVTKLLDGDVRFTCADMPEANRMMLQISAVFAEHEALMISHRTKAAIAAKRARGEPWGTNSQRQRQANGFALQLAPLIAQIRASGAQTASAIARELNRRGHGTPKGGQWHAGQVLRLLSRISHNSVDP